MNKFVFECSACNAAAPLPARGDAPGAQACVRRARRLLPRRARYLTALEGEARIDRSPQSVSGLLS